ncbi:hypothetical protein MAUB1S_11430 [Mycolicibacterium aubagnense]
MTALPRDIRDVLGECIRREALGLIRPLWHDYTSFNDEACEAYRRRGDMLLRLLRGYGLSIVRVGEEPGSTPATADVVYSHPLHDGSATRSIRYAGKRWEIVSTTKESSETVEQSFSLHQANINAGLVLLEAPEARTIQGLGRQLAALVEIYRVHAQGIGEQP